MNISFDHIKENCQSVQDVMKLSEGCGKKVYFKDGIGIDYFCSKQTKLCPSCQSPHRSRSAMEAKDTPEGAPATKERTFSGNIQVMKGEIKNANK